jgi:hypothetical protein
MGGVSTKVGDKVCDKGNGLKYLWAGPRRRIELIK